MFDGTHVKRCDGLRHTAEVDHFESGERQREHHVVGSDVANRPVIFEAADEAAVARGPECNQFLAEPDASGGQPFDQAGDQQIGSSVDVPLLVCSAERRTFSGLPAACSRVVLFMVVYGDSYLKGKLRNYSKFISNSESRDLFVIFFLNSFLFYK